MAGAIMTSFSAGDANATALMENANKTSIGLGSLSLTHMTDTTVPAIAAGSWIEINGAIAKFDTETAISTTDPVTSATVADGTVYIILIPSGSVVNAYFTATAPTWSDSKQGWYGLTTWANDRYAPYAMTKATTSYSAKYELVVRNSTNIKAYAAGSLTASDTVTTATLNMTTGAKHNGTFVAMYLSDGTPIYATMKTVSIAQSSSSGSVAHGISNAKTNNRIVGIIHAFGENISNKYYISNLNNGTAGYPTYYDWDDTNITVHQTSSIAGATWLHKIIIYYTA